jgi:CRISPR/Cas system-associated exonuclease Cas4 (RecB family)
MPSNIYLTKSRFKKAFECPTKLYYAFRRYPDETTVDPFLKALAEGGIQVGELAKLQFPGGVEITATNNEEALRETESHLALKTEVLFEPAFQVGERFARIDILERQGNHVRVIEVKSKSGDETSEMVRSRGNGVLSAWRPYVADVAFQRQLVADALQAKGENVTVSAHLMVMNKEAVATQDGINPMFHLERSESGRVSCTVPEGTSLEAIGEPLMTILDLDAAIQALENDVVFQEAHSILGARTFSAFMRQCEEDIVHYKAEGEPRRTPISKRCKGCEFRGADRNGQQECLAAAYGWGKAEFAAPKVWDLWNFRQTDALLAAGKRLISDLASEGVENQPKMGARQGVQIRGTLTQQPQIDLDGLRQALGNCPPPWHFIDFETTAPAIPHFQGTRPYEGMSFQFSHHVLEADGTLRHANQFLSTRAPRNPTFDFIEALYNALAHAEGTLFRYSNHENTYLRKAHRLLTSSSPFGPEKTDNILAFIDDVTVGGKRSMVDLLEIVRAHYWHPRMGGSNSIKDVLPAVMMSSAFLQLTYAQPVYGTPEMPSLNLMAGKVWLQHDPVSGQIHSPYHLLPPIDSLMPDGFEAFDRLFGDEQLGNGGAAMTAWSYMQHTTMSPEEHDALCQALLQYCELDTLAMVFIWQHFLELTEDHQVNPFG